MFLSAVFVWSWWCALHLVEATQVNITVDDSDPSVFYQPFGRWRASSTNCPSCLNPDAGVAYNRTFHEVIPMNYTSNSNASQRQKRISPRELHPQELVASTDDTMVTAQFNFTGTAIYLYCIQPLGPTASNSAPTDTNLTFTLDGHDTRTGLVHQGSSSTPGFMPHVLAFSQEGLVNTLHILRANVGPNSTFLLDYFIYTQSDTPSSSPNVTDTASSSSSQGSASTGTSKHSVAIFGGAIGGCFGGLLCVAIGVWLSLAYRRRRARLRDCEQRESVNSALHTEASEDRPMQGPAPFIPRYFPGTFPADPPPYVSRALLSPSSQSRSSSRPPSSYLIPYSAELPHHSSELLSYADRPPSVPPPLSDDPLLAVPPPTLGTTVTDPIPMPPGIIPGHLHATTAPHQLERGSRSSAEDHTTHHSPPYEGSQIPPNE